MKKWFACFLFWLSTAFGHANAQNFVLHGTITDSATGKPVIGASIFLSNTSIGTSANNSGQFTLYRVPQGRFNLVVSSLGYQTYVQSINADKLPQALQIALTPKANELSAVVVGTYDQNGWEKWGKLFLNNFIGTSNFALDCTLKNQEALKFRYSKKRDFLQAFADDALIIENKAMGYMVHYKLEGFSFDFAKHTVFYFGFPLFEEMEGSGRKQQKWKARRREAYYGSAMHFMRCLYVNKLPENGYEIKRLEKIPNVEKRRVQALYGYFVANGHSEEDFENSLPKDTLHYYKRIMDQPDETQVLHKEPLRGDSIASAADSVTAILSFTDYLQITYKNKKTPFEYTQQVLEKTDASDFITSQITLLNNHPVFVLYNGIFYQPQDLLLTGYWAWSEKIANMLPFDYWP